MIISQNLIKRQVLIRLVKIYIIYISLPKLPILVAQLKIGKIIRDIFGLASPDQMGRTSRWEGKRDQLREIESNFGFKSLRKKGKLKIKNRYEE